MPNDNIDFAAYAKVAGISVEDARLGFILTPHAMRRQMEVFEKKIRFVHYTTARGAEGILRNKAVWMRKVDTMNDVSEVHHGMRLIYAACAPQAFQERLRTVMDNISPEVRPEFEKYWSGWRDHIAPNTFVSCLSEHKDSEDLLGRLSMWRAYGRDCGVALVLRQEAMQRPAGKASLELITSPVAYLDRDGFMESFNELVSSLEQNVDFLKTQPPKELAGRLFTVFRYIAVGTKHPAFLEELEWRIIYSPLIDNSEHLKPEVEVIGDVPQPIIKIPLRDIPEVGYTGVEIPNLIDRIIIGPTDFGFAIADALCLHLSAAGVEDPGKKIFFSNIPLRSR